MARTLRRVTGAGRAPGRLLAILPLILFWALPLGLACLVPLANLSDTGAWASLRAHPQLWPALAMSLASGALSTILASGLTLAILAGAWGRPMWRRLQALSAPGLAIPHLAFALGFAFLVMPSGLIARLVAGGAAPPGWTSLQDPLGLCLSLALALKEVPFLLTAALAALGRDDAAGRLLAESRAAASLGHGRGSVMLRILLPQLLPQLRWPLLIVFVYGATVVDMALVLGPTQPPTLAVVVWRALNDAEPAVNAMGLAGTLLLTAAVAAAAGLGALLLQGLARAQRDRLSAGPSRLGAPAALAGVPGGGLLLVLALCMGLLAILAFAPRWPYPDLLPPAYSAVAVVRMLAVPGPLLLSLALSSAVAGAAVALALSWFESQPPARDRWVMGPALLALSLPQLWTVGGQYRLFLPAGLAGTLAGLFLAHLTPALAYVLIVLKGPWRAFDGRYLAAARALSATPGRALLRVKLPLLKAPVLTAGAVAFAVSIAQFVPAQLIAAGRYSTLSMEAVTLASGGDRALASAFALALSLPPLAGFLAAALLGRARWR